MQLKPITKQTFNNYYKRKKEDFVFAERRTLFADKRALNKPNFKQCYITKNNNNIGYICYWDLGEFIFIEHFAIFKEIRCQGNGTKFFKWFAENQTKPIIFEVDTPVNEISKRRIKFYNNLGFVLNKYNYIQPAYRLLGKSVPMSIMSQNKELSKNEYNTYVAQIYKNVYNKQYKN